MFCGILNLAWNFAELHNFGNLDETNQVSAHWVISSLVQILEFPIVVQMLENSTWPFWTDWTFRTFLEYARDHSVPRHHALQEVHFTFIADQTIVCMQWPICNFNASGCNVLMIKIHFSSLLSVCNAELSLNYPQQEHFVCELTSSITDPMSVGGWWDCWFKLSKSSN